MPQSMIKMVNSVYVYLTTFYVCVCVCNKNDSIVFLLQINRKMMISTVEKWLRILAKLGRGKTENKLLK